MVVTEPTNAQQYPFQLYRYFFNQNTRNLASGVPVLNPDPGAIIWDAFFVIYHAFDGTTPKADIGFYGMKNGVQTLSEAGPPTAGNFTATFKGQAATIAWNSTAAAAQTALQALSTIGSGNVVCSGGPLPGTPIVCTFQGALENAEVPNMTVDSTGLTGGTAAVTTSDDGLFASFTQAATPVSLASASAEFGPGLKIAGQEDSTRIAIADPPDPPLELQLIVNSTGAPGGAASGSTIGSAALYLVVAEPVSLNSIDAPLPLN